MTAAEDRAPTDHVMSLRRKNLTLNEDEIWVLYRLLASELGTLTPSVFPDSDTVHRHPAGMALAKLSDAHIDLITPKERDV